MRMFNTQLYLLSACCKFIYGLSLWNNRATYSRRVFKFFEVAYRIVFKKMVCVSLHASNHITADICGQLLLQHQIATLPSNYCQRVSNSSSLIFRLNFSFLKSGYFVGYHHQLFQCVLLCSRCSCLLGSAGFRSTNHEVITIFFVYFTNLILYFWRLYA